MKSRERFKTFVDNFIRENGKPLMFGICRCEFGQKSGDVIDVSYPVVNVDENMGSFAAFASASKAKFEDNEIVVWIDEGFIHRSLDILAPFVSEAETGGQSHKNVQVLLELKNELDRGKLYEYTDGKKKSRFQFVAVRQDEHVRSIQVAHMKLHALSSGKVPLRGLVMDGIFGALKNLAWSGGVPYELEYLRENEIKLKVLGRFPLIDYIDKFPRYLMKVLPEFDNVRLLDSANTRFGAYLGEGYVQMPGASYVNFNAGALGACMNEGRISSSVVVGRGTDIGGGASVLGILSGGNSVPISIGENCLLGANSVTGISLGNGCIVDAGVSILGGSIVEIEQDEVRKIEECNAGCGHVRLVPKLTNLYKGSELSGLNGVHFRTHSSTGKLIAFQSRRHIELNKSLH